MVGKVGIPQHALEDEENIGGCPSSFVEEMYSSLAVAIMYKVWSVFIVVFAKEKGRSNDRPF